MTYKIVERFVSIDGEGPSAGELAIFIRFYDCNLKCLWCDTKYSFEEQGQTELLTCDEIFQYIKESHISNVTITGGEPLLNENIKLLLDRLEVCGNLNIHIETNGSICIKALKQQNYKNISFVLDYKLPLSGMEGFMCLDNFSLVDIHDVYKFVIAGREDLNRAYEIITSYNLIQKCAVHFSPALGLFDPIEIINFMKEKSLTGVKLQMQLHKFIWPREARGV